MARALVLLSGGLDSAVAYWWALREGLDPVALSFHYPGRPRGEVEATRGLVRAAGRNDLIECELPFLQEAADGAPGAFASAPPGYIPARNALFYAVAAHHAQILGCGLIVGGHNAEDAARYPDASASFFGDLEPLLRRGLWIPPGGEAPALRMPLIGLGREEVIALGGRLGAPLETTWSCYEDGAAPCGACPACLRRGGVPTVVARSARRSRRP